MKQQCEAHPIQASQWEGLETLKKWEEGTHWVWKVSGQQQTKRKGQGQRGKTTLTQAPAQAAHIPLPSTQNWEYREMRSKSPSTGAGPRA